EALQLVLEPLDLRDVALERLLGADRDRLGRELERARVDAARAIAQERAELPRQEPAKSVVRERSQIADRRDAPTAQPLLGPRAHAGQPPHEKGREERRLAAGRDDRQAAGLAPVARDLRDHLAGGDAERARERSGST